MAKHGDGCQLQLGLRETGYWLVTDHANASSTWWKGMHNLQLHLYADDCHVYTCAAVVM